MSELQKKISIFIFGLIGLLYILVQIDGIRRNKESSVKALAVTEEARIVASKSQRNKEIEDYLSCNLGASSCFKLYPEGAKAVIEAKESSKTKSGN